VLINPGSAPFQELSISRCLVLVRLLLIPSVDFSTLFLSSGFFFVLGTLWSMTLSRMNLFRLYGLTLIKLGSRRNWLDATDGEANQIDNLTPADSYRIHRSTTRQSRRVHETTVMHLSRSCILINKLTLNFLEHPQSKGMPIIEHSSTPCPKI